MNILSTIKNALSFKPTQPTTKQKAINNISKQQLYRSSSDAKRLREAVAAAESIYAPNRLHLYRIYQEINDDPHLTSVVQSRKIKAISKNFQLISTKGTKRKENLEAKKLFEGSWFPQFLEYAWESLMYGYSLVQLEGIDETGNVTGVSLVPRENVKPQLGIYTAQPGENTGWAIEENEWLVGIGKASDLGVFQKVAKQVLYKTHALAAQAQFVELFGMPIRLGKVNAGDEERARSMYQMLENMGAAGFGVMDNTDQVEFVETSKGGTGNVHQVLIEYLDAQVSKAIFGQTMMSDNGSSRSQSEVHERLADDYSIHDQRILAYYINDHLLPKLVKLGLPLKNLKFEWETIEDNTQLFERTIALLAAGYDVDTEWITETFDIPVKIKEVPAPQIPDNQAAEAAEAAADTPEPVSESKPEKPEKTE